jgi:uncharacterized protein Yka (UPF0111/DUF47 family)
MISAVHTPSVKKAEREHPLLHALPTGPRRCLFPFSKNLFLRRRIGYGGTRVRCKKGVRPVFRLPSFLPRQDKFHHLLGDMAAQSHACARHLKTFVEGGDEPARKAASDAIDACKASAKATLARVTAELCRSYITPFDREDIQEFSSQLYKVTKTMEKVRERMQLHGLSSYREDFTKQTALIVREAETMEAMVRDLAKGHNLDIQKQVGILQNLEVQGDSVLGELLVALFDQGHSTRDLILRKDIYDMLEKVIDRYRDAGSVALQIVLKHG